MTVWVLCVMLNRMEAGNCLPISEPLSHDRCTAALASWQQAADRWAVRSGLNRQATVSFCLRQMAT